MSYTPMMSEGGALGMEQGVTAAISLFPPKKMQSSAQWLGKACFDFWRNSAFQKDDNCPQRLRLVKRPQTVYMN